MSAAKTKTVEAQSQTDIAASRTSEQEPTEAMGSMLPTKIASEGSSKLDTKSTQNNGISLDQSASNAKKGKEVKEKNANKVRKAMSKKKYVQKERRQSSTDKPVLSETFQHTMLPTKIASEGSSKLDTKSTQNNSILLDQSASNAKKGKEVKDTNPSVLEKEKKAAEAMATKESMQSELRQSSMDKPVLSEKVQHLRDEAIGMSYEQKIHKYKLRKQSVKLQDIPTWADHSLRTNSGMSSDVDSYTPDDFLNTKVSIWKGDITHLEIDCIVNAANTSLLGGGGVDGAIHDAAGDNLYDECVLLRGCKVGEVKDTAGYRLPARYVLHTVGPFGEKEDMLTSCYESSLRKMWQLGQKSIAFPCIATGIYGYPNHLAVHVALRAVRKFLEDLKANNKLNNLDRVIFCLFLDVDTKLYGHWMQHYFPVSSSSSASEQNNPVGYNQVSGQQEPRANGQRTSKNDEPSDERQGLGNNVTPSESRGAGVKQGLRDSARNLPENDSKEIAATNKDSTAAPKATSIKPDSKGTAVTNKDSAMAPTATSIKPDSKGTAVTNKDSAMAPTATSIKPDSKGTAVMNKDSAMAPTATSIKPDSKGTAATNKDSAMVPTATSIKPDSNGTAATNKDSAMAPTATSIKPDSKGTAVMNKDSSEKQKASDRNASKEQGTGGSQTTDSTGSTYL